MSLRAEITGGIKRNVPSADNTAAAHAPGAINERLRGSRRLLLLLHKLELDRNLNFVANYPSSIDEHVHREPELLAIDLALGAVRHAMAHPLVVDLAVAFHFERHRPSDPLDGQITGHLVLVVPGGLDLGSLERDRRELFHAQAVRPAHVHVPPR